jgi:hypothetical protein
MFSDKNDASPDIFIVFLYRNHTEINIFTLFLIIKTGA